MAPRNRSRFSDDDVEHAARKILGAGSRMTVGLLAGRIPLSRASLANRLHAIDWTPSGCANTAFWLPPFVGPRRADGST